MSEETAAVATEILPGAELPTTSMGSGPAKRALFLAQQKFPEIPKDKENKHFNTWYSSLDAVKTACWPHLHEVGLLPYWKTWQEGGFLFCMFVVEHIDSGDRATNTLKGADGETMHALGSLITYLRKYTAGPLLGICPDEDDDGNVASVDKKAKQQTSASPAPAAAPAVSWHADRILETKSPVELTNLLFRWRNDKPPAEHPARWAMVIGDVRKHANDSKWAQDEKAAVLRATIKDISDVITPLLTPPAAAAATQAAPAQQAPPADAIAPPTLASLQMEVDAMLTPDDLLVHLKMMANGDRPRAIAARADAKLWLGFVSHAVESIHGRLGRDDGGWGARECEAVGILATDLKKEAEGYSQTKEASGGTN